MFRPVKSLYGLDDAILGDDYQLCPLFFVEIWPALTRLLLLEDAVCRGYLYGTFCPTFSTLLRALAGSQSSFLPKPASPLPTIMAEKEVALDPSNKEYQAASPGSSSIDEGLVNINERALLRKLDLRLLPPVTILYLLSFLDRSNSLFYPSPRMRAVLNFL